MAVFGVVMFADSGPVPGWHLSGTNTRSFVIGLDSDTAHGGRASGTLRCIQKRCKGFGTLAQTIRADQYRGSRVRLSAWVQASKAVRPRLWMRVDGIWSEMLAFDNVDDRAK